MRFYFAWMVINFVCGLVLIAMGAAVCAMTTRTEDVDPKGKVAMMLLPSATSAVVYIVPGALLILAGLLLLVQGVVQATVLSGDDRVAGTRLAKKELQRMVDDWVDVLPRSKFDIESSISPASL